MKRILLPIIIIINVSGYSKNPDTIFNVSFSVTDKQFIEVNYSISAAYSKNYFDVSLWVSSNDGESFYGPLKHVSGDVGKNIKQGKKKTILWDVNKEMPGFGGNVAIEVRAYVFPLRTELSEQPDNVSVIPEKTSHKTPDRHFFFGYKGSYFSPIGAVIGFTGKPGFYLSARMNSGLFEDALYTTDGEVIEGFTYADYGLFTGSDKTQRLSVTAGLQFQLSPSTNLYFGAGYSSYALLWQVDEYYYPDQYIGKEWAEYTDESYNGVEIELGFMFHFGHFFLSPGVNFQPYKNTDGSKGMGLDGSLGVGVIF